MILLALLRPATCPKIWQQLMWKITGKILFLFSFFFFPSLFFHFSSFFLQICSFSLAIHLRTPVTTLVFNQRTFNSWRWRICEPFMLLFISFSSHGSFYPTTSQQKHKPLCKTISSGHHTLRKANLMHKICIFTTKWPNFYWKSQSQYWAKIESKRGKRRGERNC